MVALGSVYSFALFSSLNNLKPASLTGTLKVGKETFPGDFFSCTVYCLVSYRATHAGMGRAEPDAHTALLPGM